MIKLRDILFSFCCILIVFVTGCSSDSTQKLASLEQTQQQTQHQLLKTKKQLEEVRERARKYNELSDKYQKLMQEQTADIKKLKQQYAGLGSAKTSDKTVVKSKLIESAQKSVILQKRLKRYTSKVNVYEEKSRKLEEKVKAAEDSFKKADVEIKQIKKNNG